MSSSRNVAADDPAPMGFGRTAAELDHQLNAAYDANVARRAQMLHHFTGNGVMGHFTDVSPLLMAPAARAPSVGWRPSYAAQHAAMDPGLGGYPPLQSHLITTSEAVDKQVRDAVTKALAAHEDRVAEIVSREWERRAQELEHSLRNRFVDLQVLNDSTGRLLRDVGASVAQLKADVAANNEKHEAALASLASDLKGKITELGRTTNREILSMRETVMELQSRYAVDTADFGRRIDTAHRRAADAYAEAIGVVDQRTAQMRADLENAHRDTSRRLQGEVDAALRVAQDSNAVVGRGDAELRRLATKVSELLEDAAVRRSDIRTMRDDVQQLELYMKGRIDRVATTASRGVAGGGAAAATTVGQIEMERVQRDLYSLQQGVAYLTSRMQAYGFLDDEDAGHQAIDRIVRAPAAATPLAARGYETGASQHHVFAVSDLTAPGASALKTTTANKSAASGRRASIRRDEEGDRDAMAAMMDDGDGDMGDSDEGKLSPMKGGHGANVLGPSAISAYAKQRSTTNTAAKRAMRYSQVSDPFNHSSGSFDLRDRAPSELVGGRLRDSDEDSNRQLAKSQID